MADDIHTKPFCVIDSQARSQVHLRFFDGVRRMSLDLLLLKNRVLIDGLMEG